MAQVLPNIGQHYFDPAVGHNQQWAVLWGKVSRVARWANSVETALELTGITFSVDRPRLSSISSAVLQKHILDTFSGIFVFYSLLLLSGAFTLVQRLFCVSDILYLNHYLVVNQPYRIPFGFGTS